MKVSDVPGSGPKADVIPAKPVPRAETSNAGEAAEREIDRHKLNQAVAKLNRTSAIFSTDLRFKVHEGSKRVMVQIVDQKTGEVVKEIPPQKVLDVIGAIRETLGLIFDELY